MYMYMLYSIKIPSPGSSLDYATSLIFYQANQREFLCLYKYTKYIDQSPPFLVQLEVAKPSYVGVCML